MLNAAQWALGPEERKTLRELQQHHQLPVIQGRITSIGDHHAELVAEVEPIEWVGEPPPGGVVDVILCVRPNEIEPADVEPPPLRQDHQPGTTRVPRVFSDASLAVMSNPPPFWF